MATAETSVRPRRSVTQLNRKVYLGLYDSRQWPEPDSRDEQRVRDYMVQKYENKRWFVAPTDAMKEDAKRANEAALNSKPQAKPLRAMLGENASHKIGAVPAVHPSPVSVPLPSAFKAPATAPASIQPNNIAAPAAAPAKPSSGFDLLGELGGDPFASNTPAPVSNSDGGFAGGFADFSNFNSLSSPSPQSQQPPSAAFPISNTPLQPMGLTPIATNAPPAAQAPAQTNEATTFASISDKYAALADLDCAFSTPTTTATSIEWGGNAVNWGGQSSMGTPVSSPSGPPGVSWSGGHPAGGPINWNSSGSGMPANAAAAPSVFGQPAAANPFGAATSNPGMPAYSSAAQSSTVNPFGTPGMNQFSQAGGVGGAPAVGMPASSAAPGFGAQFPPATSAFGQFPPMQNGGFGMTPTTAGGFGGAGAFSQQAFMMPAQPQQAGAQQTGWGNMGAAPSQMPAAGHPMANPFMSTAMQQQVPPPSGSTNPFL